MLPSTFAQGQSWTVLRGDCLDLLPIIHPGTVALVFADPPYYLSAGGTTCRAGQRAAVDKGEWDRPRGLLEEHRLFKGWTALAGQLLTAEGTLWACGTRHGIFNLGFALQLTGWHILNLVSWGKPNAPPNLACRSLKDSTEYLIWASRRGGNTLALPGCGVGEGKVGGRHLHRFNYAEAKELADGKQMRTDWTFTTAPRRERRHGSHPTQKPVALVERAIRICTAPGDLVLDPFCGSGTTGVAALRCGRRFLGIEMEDRWCQVAAARLVEEEAGPPPTPERKPRARLDAELVRGAWATSTLEQLQAGPARFAELASGEPGQRGARAVLRWLLGQGTVLRERSGPHRGGAWIYRLAERAATEVEP